MTSNMPQIDAVLLAAIVALLTFISAIVQAERKEAKTYRADNEKKITSLFGMVGKIHEGLKVFETRTDKEGLYHSKLHEGIDNSFKEVHTILNNHECEITANREAIIELKHHKKSEQ